MTNFKMMVTQEGKHPASKWAMLAADEIVDISAESEATKMKEAMAFKDKLISMLTNHHQLMMDHEQEWITAGKHDIDLPYETEEHAKKVVDEICNLAKGTSFSDHFAQDHVRAHLAAVCNNYFKSAKLVERHHYHSEAAKSKAATPKTTKKS